MSASPPPGLFKPAHQGHSLATLVLIENSAAMVDRWPDLRDRYLPTLLGTVRKVNPFVPIHVLFLTSCPVSAPEEAIALPNNSRYHHLPEVRFSQQPNNKITAANLFNATDILATTFLEVNTTRHLFVIAAFRPIRMRGCSRRRSTDELAGIGLQIDKGWSPTAHENIHLHMILNPKAHASDHFTQLFYDVLAMQRFQEASTWFLVNSDDYRFHLSMRPQGNQEVTVRPSPSAVSHPTSVIFPGTASAVSPSLLTPTSCISGLSIASPLTDSFPDASAPPPSSLSQLPQRTPLPRNNSFPPAGANGRLVPSRLTTTSSITNSPPPPIASFPSGSDTEPKPSLVKHLQKIHGLTKKRNYGLQTARAPFIRDETNSSSAFPPAQSLDPVTGRPRRNTGVHASKNKRGDDPRRPRRGSIHVGLPESVRVSSPESDSSASVSAPSPTATVTGVLASAVGPVSVGLQTGTPVSAPDLGDVAYANAPPQPLWQQTETLVQQAAPANSAPAFTDMLPPQQLPPQAHALLPTQVQGPLQRTHVPVTAPLGSSFSNVPHGNADSTVAYSNAAPAVGSSFVSQPQPLPPAPPADDGDKPFIFYPEYEEAIVPPPFPLFAPLSAAAQSATVAQYWQTSGGDYSHVLNPAVGPGLIRAGPPPVYDAPVFDSTAHSQPVHSHVSAHMQAGVVYASEQSSSLQSWAGY
ncbi:hypothetical protein F5148DRAFT_1290035 [Russula earlei]|uniref:Uncharacterized protein n=1 Tax=Russula earlei TaxID=71964 RepID=A0ACC0TWE2_9AGAM|nr:hypothetical protein F5148DRAFT_1290035 [Russula earlei]